jgi:hypothetical protein
MLMMIHDLNVLLKYVIADEFMYHKVMFYHLINQLLNSSLVDGRIMNKYMCLMVVNIIGQSFMDSKDILFITSQ